jgi:hypothetical protein
VNYRYTAIYSIKGLSLLPTEGDKELVVDSTIGLRAILTSQPDSHSLEADRSLAMANLMLRDLFHAEPVGEEFKQRVADAVEEIRAGRGKESGSGPFLVVIGKGEVSSFTPSHEKDAEDFIVCFDGADKDEIRARFQSTITALMISIISEMESLIGIKKVADAVVFLREDGKPVYSYTVSLGPATLHGSKPLTDENAQTVGELYRLFAADTTLQRVQRLLSSSFETEQDSLRSFLAAWSAFEIFVNKVFGTYEHRFFKSTLEEGRPEVQKQYLERIREVMKDKYRLADKFVVVSVHLSHDTADEDLKTVRQVKKVRDKLSHGESVDEATLPVKAIRHLVSKYLRLHIEDERRTKT